MVLQFTDLVISLLTLGVSMAVLSYASRYVILAVESFMQFTGLSETSVGFALLSVITSTPELLVAVFAISAGVQSLSEHRSSGRDTDVDSWVPQGMPRRFGRDSRPSTAFFGYSSDPCDCEAANRVHRFRSTLDLCLQCL
ncbi:MAG: hypothetical protein ACXACF_12685 [Candidatus Hermodarchaeia archaeon]